jgi:uncharacterized membrane protein YccC
VSVLSARAVLYGLNCYLAVMMALWFAFTFDLKTPFWAMLTVIITSQPIAGAVLSKAFYRVVGTLVGVAASIVIIPNLSNAPELMLLAIAAWVGIALFLSQLFRGPNSYAFVLAGYTVALVGLPLVTNPNDIFDTSIARAEEVTVGALCTALAHGLIFPRDTHDAVVAKLTSMMRDARSYIVAGLTGRLPPPEQQARRRLASDLTELTLLAAHLPFQSLARHSGVQVVRALEQRLSGLLPLLSAVEDRLSALRETSAVAEPVQRLVDDVRLWVEDGDDNDRDSAPLFLARCDLATPRTGPASSWQDALIVSLTERLAELIAHWRDSIELANLVRDASLRPSARVQGLIDSARWRPLHLDAGMAMHSGLATAVAVLACGIFAISLDWTEGFIAVGLTAVLCSLSSALDDPSPILRAFFVFNLIATPLAAVYVFAILPAIDGFPLLCLVMFPLIVPIGMFMAVPKYALLGLTFGILVTAGISVQTSFNPDFTAFAIATIAATTGLVISMFVLRTLRVVSAEVSAVRILRAGWVELAELAAGARPLSRQIWVSRMIDRVALLTPRMAQAGPVEGLRLTDALNDLRLGVNIVDLQEAAQRMPEASKYAVEDLLKQLAFHFRGQAQRGHRSPEATLIDSIDAAIREVLGTSDSQVRKHGLAASVGLRRNLFASADGFVNARPST